MHSDLVRVHEIHTLHRWYGLPSPALRRSIAIGGPVPPEERVTVVPIRAPGARPHRYEEEAPAPTPARVVKAAGTSLSAALRVAVTSTGLFGCGVLAIDLFDLDQTGALGVGVAAVLAAVFLPLSLGVEKAGPDSRSACSSRW